MATETLEHLNHERRDQPHEAQHVDQFGYVMVLVSIIVGLGIAHLHLGASGIIDRLASRRLPLRLSVAYLAWLGDSWWS